MKKLKEKRKTEKKASTSSLTHMNTFSLLVQTLEMGGKKTASFEAKQGGRMKNMSLIFEIEK